MTQVLASKPGDQWKELQWGW